VSPSYTPRALSSDVLGSVRNHGGVPDIDDDAMFIEIGGLVNTPVKISLKDLQDPEKFPYGSILLCM
jgi:sulfite oxidase